MKSYYSDEYLSHHGIKGQKWGIRRYQNVDGTRTAAGKIRDTKRDRLNANKNRSQLSDKELNDRINRLQKEQQLDRLTREQYKRGRSYIEGIVKNQGNQVAAAVTATVVAAVVTPKINAWLKGN